MMNDRKRILMENSIFLGNEMLSEGKFLNKVAEIFLGKKVEVKSSEFKNSRRKVIGGINSMFESVFKSIKDTDSKVGNAFRDMDRKALEKKKVKVIDYVEKIYDKILKNGKGRISYKILTRADTFGANAKQMITKLANELNQSLPEYINAEVWVTYTNHTPSSYSIKLISKRIFLVD